MVDTPYGKAILVEARRLGWPIDIVLITHWPAAHSGGSAATSETGARIFVPGEGRATPDCACLPQIVVRSTLMIQIMDFDGWAMKHTILSSKDPPKRDAHPSKPQTESSMTIAGKTILVTGATGQLAGAVARGLVGDNEIIALARFTAPGSREALEQAGVKCVRGDFVTRDFKEAPRQVDYVFHAAANTKPATMEEGMRDNAEGTAFLMEHYRDAKAFLHVSATGCYAAHPDPEHVFTEDEPLGGSTWFAPMYGVSKTATEGVVRALCQIYGMPTVIGRMNVAYGGPYFDGGLPGRQLDAILAGEPIRLQRGARWFQAPIHEDDITRHVPILLEQATVPATIINWGGDEGVEVEEWVRYLGRLVGREPCFEYDERPRSASWIGDHSRRIAMGCDCRVPWREGMKRMIAARRPDVVIHDVD